ncbi:MAG: aspartate kinase [Cyclobacteriaceae bacterium]|nr:aspartate kinase [Cyclobacteriaceae bacterium]
MRVFKFGGASVRNANSIKKVATIIQFYIDQPLLIVVSAMGKTTNALERLLNLKNGNLEHELNQIITYHSIIIEELFEGKNPLAEELRSIKSNILEQLKNTDSTPEELYDQVVSQGEIISTLIVSAYLKKIGLPSLWKDARKYIVTDVSFCEAVVNWDQSNNLIQSLTDVLNKSIVITQGFIGSTKDGRTTTLGREGSDFSAAIFASCLSAESVTIWKDVPGVMSADPKRLPAAITFEELPFREAAEMTYYGASVIHPKTIKPLANRNIPLIVKSFDNIDLPGTRIHECKIDQLPPLIVFKDNQCLISCQVTDYTFIDESQIGIIFSALSTRNLKVNMIQNSAISFSFCLDFKEEKVLELIEELGKIFEVYYNTGLTLITIKNYDTDSYNKYKNQKNVVLEQSSRSTLQVLIKSTPLIASEQ